MDKTHKARAHEYIARVARLNATQALIYRHAEEYGRLYAIAYTQEMAEAKEDGRWPWPLPHFSPEHPST